MEVQKEFDKLKKMGKEIYILRGVNALLSWDQETYMPPDGANPRSDQLELMASLAHKAETSKKFSSGLSKLIDMHSGKVIVKGLKAKDQRALQEWRRHYLKLTKLPGAFIKKWAKSTSTAIHAWAIAKQNDDFAKFLPHLEKIVEMNQEKASLLGYKDHPYDALIDLHEPDMTKKKLDDLFIELKKPLKNLLGEILNAKVPDTSCLDGHFSQEKQLKAAHYLLEKMGYDFKKGRLDISSHPFSTTFHPHDSRITTRIDPHNFMNNIGVVLHEGGHALYEMGLPVEEFGTPLAEAVSLGIHESQSRFWETRIGQSRAFVQAFLPYFKKQFELKEIGVDPFYKAINFVKPSFIRVDSDEVTYSFHVILRYEIECLLLEGKIKVKELPEIWNAKMNEYLRITPKSNKEGCLQDIHWSMGELGYFPTYTLGNLFASHIFLGFEKDHPDYEQKIANQELLFIKDWLSEQIHQWGKQFSSIELAQRASKGIPFSSKAYIDYLNNKYRAIYGF